MRIGVETGASLRAQREALGLSVDDVESRGIPSAQLAAIESGGDAKAHFYWRLIALLDHLRRATPLSNPPYLAALGRLVRRERERRGLSIDDLAEKTALQAGWIAALEQAGATCEVLSLEALTRRGFGLQLSELIEAVEHILGQWRPSV